MNVIVIGGMGFIGTQTVKTLINANCEVLVFHRGFTHSSFANDIQTVIGEKENLSDYKKDFYNFKPDVVIDLIAFTESDGRQLVEVFDGFTERIILISSMDVYRNYGLFCGSEKTTPNKIPINENSKLRSKYYPYRSLAKSKDEFLYNYDKIPIEEAVLKLKNSNGVVLRLPKVYGIGDKKHRLYEYLKPMQDGREFILLDKKHADWLWTRGYVENVAEAIKICTINKKSENQVYNIADKDTFSESEWIEKIGRIIGWSGEVLSLNQEELPMHLQTPYNYEYHVKASSDKIRKELAFEDKFSLDDALKKSIEWEIANLPSEFDGKLFDYKAEDKKIGKFI